jgi:hypothetical protein
MICVSAAKAREVDLVRFSPIAVAASNEQGTVGTALSAHFERLVESVHAPGISEGTHATGGCEDFLLWAAGTLTSASVAVPRPCDALGHGGHPPVA